MERHAFLMQLKPGMEAEYQRRHDAIWPELVEALKDAGVHDYSIFLDRRTGTLFAVQKLEDRARAAKLREHPVVRRWWASMAPLMETHPDDAPVEWPVDEVFRLD
jgi:L-rhamnose mutarotase